MIILKARKQENLYYRILNHIDEPIEISIDYSEREDEITISFKAKGIRADFMNEAATLGDSTGVSDSIIAKFAEGIQCEEGRIRIKA